MATSLNPWPTLKFIKKMIIQIQKKIIFLLTLLVIFLLSNGCSDEEIIQDNEKPFCVEEGPTFSKLKLETYSDKDTSITCPRFIFWERPFYIGDTLALFVNARYDDSGKPIIFDKPVYVTINSRLGDEETYWLKSGSWPCQIRATDIEFFYGIVFYNTYKVGNASPNNGQLEINISGDTLIASYKSYCTGNVVMDTIAILPK